MRSHALRTGLIVSLAAAPLVVASAAVADTTLGDSSPTAASPCTGGAYTLVQISASTGTFTVPSAGVITSVRLGGSTTAPATRSFKLVRGEGGNVYQVVATSPTVTIPTGQTASQNVRIPAQAGDHLGVGASGTSPCATTGTTADVYTGTTADVAAGQTFTNSTFTGFRFSVAATVEADANNDGYGDTSQEIGTLGAPAGRAKVGKKLAAPTVSNLPAGATEKFQWYRLVTLKRHGHVRHVYRPIAAAHGSHYKLRVLDKGKRIKVRIAVTAANYNPAPTYSLSKRIH